jgi:hypothetical protein
MKSSMLLSVAALALAAVAHAGAAGDHEMQAAQHELKIAMDHLRDAGTDYGGHRRAAMDHIDRALKEIQQAIGSKGKQTPKEPSERPADDD